MRESLLADAFLMSTNAITLDGELLNIDGNGNRVAALCFGPKYVIVLAGMNKVAADLHAAYARGEGGRLRAERRALPRGDPVREDRRLPRLRGAGLPVRADCRPRATAKYRGASM